MKALSKFLIFSVVSAALSLTILSTSNAADAGDNKDSPTKAFMKKYHKAPKGTDPIAKRAQEGKATPAELKELAAGYHAMAKAKPPQGDMASWKEKTTKLAAAADALVKGDPDARGLYKEAVNCKACHEVHKPK
jgi:cytochrome c556